MKKKIISILCAFMMFAAPMKPIFAADNSALYLEFKEVVRKNLDAKFTAKYNEFSISSDGNTYNVAEKSMIILEAWNKGFSSFSELDQNVTAAAAKLRNKKANPKAPDSTMTGYETGYNSTKPFTSPTDTNPDDVFAIGGKEFIYLDCEEVDGEKMFFVMAKDYYGTNVAYHGDSLAEWNDTYYRTLAYKLTKQVAFGGYSSSGKDLPEEVLRNIDILHEWHIEPRVENGDHSTIIAPVTLISASEYLKYSSKIGLDRPSDAKNYWTRTQVRDGSEIYIVSIIAGENRQLYGQSTSSGRALRPVFYLKSSFFKNEKLVKCGANVTKMLEEEGILTQGEFNYLYNNDDKKTVFGLNVEPTEITGDLMVGRTLSVDYTPNAKFPPVSVDITWERSTDKVTWQSTGGSGKTYTLQAADSGHFIRAVFKPTFNSQIWREGAITYKETANAVFTDAEIQSAIQEVIGASDADALRDKLEEHYVKFQLPYEESNFPDGAATILKNGSPTSIAELQLLYHQAKALYAFSSSSDVDAREKAENSYLLGSIDDYDELLEDGKNSVVLNLFLLESDSLEKTNINEFLKTAEKFVMLERFSRAERVFDNKGHNVITILREYESTLKDLGVDFSGLNDYQLETVGRKVAEKDYGTNLDLLLDAIDEGISEAENVTTPDSPIIGETDKHSYGGFVPPVTEKPGFSGNAPVNLFTDLDNVPWAAAAINSLAQDGILSGNGDGTFAPDRLVTRNEFVKMIVAAFKVEMSDNILPYEDIEKGSWSEEYIAAAVNAGIISGIDETHFGDGQNIIRQDVAVIAERLMQYKGIELKSSTVNFADSKQIADYALQAVAKMNYARIMNGKDDNKFEPEAGTTRAEAAVVIYNLINYYKEKTETKPDTDDIVVVKNQVEKYDLVFQLGILKDEFAKDPKITRGEFAAAMTVFGNHSNYQYEGIFSDVPSGHKYAKEIETVYKNNILAPRTEKLFAPDEVVTYGEAYEAIIAASGCTKFSNGRQDAELALARETVFARKDDELTINTLKKMLFAALEIKAYDFVDSDAAVISNSTILNVNFGVYKEKGIVSSVAGMSIGGRKIIDDDEIIITVDGKDYLYFGNDLDYSDFLGYEVTYYYKEVEDEFQILSMSLADTSIAAPLKLSFEKIVSASDDLLSITYEYKNKTKTVQIAKKADFIYNGRRTFEVSRDDLVPDNGYITLIDANYDGIYEVVRIEKYEYIMVAQIDSNNQSVLDKFTLNKTIGLKEGKDADTVNITKNGRYVKLDNISVGDVLAVARSNRGEEPRDGDVINVYVSDKKITGNVRIKSPDKYEIEIEGNKLKTVRDFNFGDIASNMRITVGLDWNGYAIGYYAEQSDSDTIFGYLYDVGVSKGLNTRNLYILTENNQYVKLDTNEKLIINDVPGGQTDLVTLVQPMQLIAYNLDADGKIKRIYYNPSGQTTEAGSLNQSPLVLNDKYEKENVPSALYNGFGMTLGYNYTFTSSGIIFDITLDNGRLVKESSRATKVSAQAIPQNMESASKQTEESRLYIYNADALKVSNLGVYTHLPKGGNDGYKDPPSGARAFIVSDIIEKYDSAKSEFLTVYKGYHTGNEVEFTFSENLTEPSDPTKAVDISKIQPGDALLVWLSGNEITRFRRLYSSDEDNKYTDRSDLLCSYGNKTYTTPAQFILEVAEGKNSSASAVGSRWTSNFGNIELIYKAENYAQPILKFKLKGDSIYKAYSLDSVTTIYEYDTEKRTIRILDKEGINISGKNIEAILTTSYGNVRDVIIYE